MITKLSIFFILFLVTCDAEAAQKDNIIGNLIKYEIKEEETLYDIARKFDVGIDELIYANIRVDPWIPAVGTELIIPSMHILPTKPHKDIIINKAELRLYFFPVENDIEKLMTFPISIGVSGHDTPLGTTKVKHKQTHPFWIPPPSMRIEDPDLVKIMPPSPDNPLGDFAIYLGWDNIVIHGTNKPWSIGTYGSHGCIRMFPEDIKVLFKLVNIGTNVRIIDEPIKFGWLNDNLYLEASPNEEQKDQLDLFGHVAINPELENIKTKIGNYGAEQQKVINWEIIDKILSEYTGIPVAITE